MGALTFDCYTTRCKDRDRTLRSSPRSLLQPSPCRRVSAWASPLKLLQAHLTDTNRNRRAGSAGSPRTALHHSRARPTVPLWTFLWCAGPRCDARVPQLPKSARSRPLLKLLAHPRPCTPSCTYKAARSKPRLLKAVLAQSHISLSSVPPCSRLPPRSRLLSRSKTRSLIAALVLAARLLGSVFAVQCTLLSMAAALLPRGVAIVVSEPILYCCVHVLRRAPWTLLCAHARRLFRACCVTVLPHSE